MAKVTRLLTSISCKSCFMWVLSSLCFSGGSLVVGPQVQAFFDLVDGLPHRAVAALLGHAFEAGQHARKSAACSPCGWPSVLRPAPFGAGSSGTLGCRWSAAPSSCREHPAGGDDALPGQLHGGFPPFSLYPLGMGQGGSCTCSCNSKWVSPHCTNRPRRTQTSLANLGWI